MHSVHTSIHTSVHCTQCTDVVILCLPGVYTEYMSECINKPLDGVNVLINPRAEPEGLSIHSRMYSVYTPGRHRIAYLGSGRPTNMSSQVFTEW